MIDSSIFVNREPPGREKFSCEADYHDAFLAYYDELTKASRARLNVLLAGDSSLASQLAQALDKPETPKPNPKTLDEHRAVAWTSIRKVLMHSPVMHTSAYASVVKRNPQLLLATPASSGSLGSPQISPATARTLAKYHGAPAEDRPSSPASPFGFKSAVGATAQPAAAARRGAA